MLSIGATTSASRAAALTVSIGLHALVAWAVGSAERPRNPVARTLPMAVYLLPMPPEPREQPLPRLQAEPPPRVEKAEAIESEPAPLDAPPDSQDDATSPDSDLTSPTDRATTVRPARHAPRYRDIDWNRSIDQAISRIREQARTGYRTFGRTLPNPDNVQPAGGRDVRGEPSTSRQPGDPIQAGTQQVPVNDNCHYEVYAPGSLLEEAHRFTNSSLSCQPNGPAEPRNDLFLDARPDYLDLHLAQDDAEGDQSPP
jgi:hypothetical protein